MGIVFILWTLSCWLHVLFCKCKCKLMAPQNNWAYKWLNSPGFLCGHKADGYVFEGCCSPCLPDGWINGTVVEANTTRTGWAAESDGQSLLEATHNTCYWINGSEQWIGCQDESPQIACLTVDSCLDKLIINNDGLVPGVAMSSLGITLTVWDNRLIGTKSVLGNYMIWFFFYSFLIVENAPEIVFARSSHIVQTWKC